MAFMLGLNGEMNDKGEGVRESNCDYLTSSAGS